MAKGVHGQAANPIFTRSRLTDRAIDELVGLCKGAIADGVIVPEEARFLLVWMESNRLAADKWPANVLYPRLQAMLADGVLDENEEAELVGLMADITGGGLAPTTEDASGSTALPLTLPLPDVEFDRRLFCLTGKFCLGTRDECSMLIKNLGGFCGSAPSRSTDFLVIGTIGSRDWIHSTHGRKIEKAVELRGEGHPISIISEEWWVDALRKVGAISL